MQLVELPILRQKVTNCTFIGNVLFKKINVNQNSVTHEKYDD